MQPLQQPSLLQSQRQWHRSLILQVAGDHALSSSQQLQCSCLHSQQPNSISNKCQILYTGEREIIAVCTKKKKITQKLYSIMTNSSLSIKQPNCMKQPKEIYPVPTSSTTNQNIIRSRLKWLLQSLNIVDNHTCQST